MPLCRAGSKLIYFTHVPKCGGTSVERYLIARFGALGFHDPAFGSRDTAEVWTMTPPQHMPGPVQALLLPETLFDAHFATVRHPAHRLISMFLFMRDIEDKLPPDFTFSEWLSNLPDIVATQPFALHGHPRPMSEYIPENATVFHVESGLDHIVNWLDQMAHTQDGPRNVPHSNAYQDRISTTLKDRPKPQLTQKNLMQIFELYAEDYNRFDYPIDPSEMEYP